MIEPLEPLVFAFESDHELTKQIASATLKNRAKLNEIIDVVNGRGSQKPLEPVPDAAIDHYLHERLQNNGLSLSTAKSNASISAYPDTGFNIQTTTSVQAGHTPTNGIRVSEPGEFIVNGAPVKNTQT